MPVVVTLQEKHKDNREIKVLATVVFSGTYASGGEPYDAGPLNPFISARPPDRCIVVGNAGFIYSYDKALKLIHIWCNVAGGANNGLGEHTNVAVVAGVLADIIFLEAVWYA